MSRGRDPRGGGASSKLASRLRSGSLAGSKTVGGSKTSGVTNVFFFAKAQRSGAKGLFLYWFGCLILFVKRDERNSSYFLKKWRALHHFITKGRRAYDWFISEKSAKN
jgi:hypothetical protein